ncbi:DoxX family protein [Aurantibacillus circumpalustris]|uniref:DoxX family protein n=1 Tax=Aurantibacillus circumpalustris TaxID=3036359 RepID=UPI00295BB945|nr:DoxX family protein [Aurantibacillus circumpalustris]
MKTEINALNAATNSKSNKVTKIIYWTITGLVALGFLMSSFMYLTKAPELMENFSKAGYPVYFVTILGLAKLLGAIALVNPWFPKLKEWAYAGFTFVLIGAVWTHVATSTPFAAPLVFLILLTASYFFNLKMNAKASVQNLATT